MNVSFSEINFNNQRTVIRKMYRIIVLHSYTQNQIIIKILLRFLLQKSYRSTAFTAFEKGVLMRKNPSRYSAKRVGIKTRFARAHGQQ